jgi:hypothetical protein
MRISEVVMIVVCESAAEIIELVIYCSVSGDR